MTAYATPACLVYRCSTTPAPTNLFGDIDAADLRPLRHVPGTHELAGVARNGIRTSLIGKLGEGCIPRAADGLLGVAAPYVFARDSIGQSIPVLPQEAFPETEFTIALL